MEISKEQLLLAAAQAGISKHQTEALWDILKKESRYVSPFSNFIFYFGAMTIIAAMTWFLGLSWGWFEGGALFLISMVYTIVFAGVGAKLWRKPNLKIPAGLLITLAVCMVPLAIYGLETYLGVWPQEAHIQNKDFSYLLRNSWIFMEIGTILAGCFALRFFSFPFITAPIFLAAWLLAVDTLPRLLGMAEAEDQRAWITLCFGIVILVIAYIMDRRKIQDYAFWGYLFGALAFWIGLTSLNWDKGEFIFFIYLLVNLLLMVLSILLQRKVLMLCGVLGAFIYFGHLANEIFKDSMLFPVIVSLIGLLIMYLGVLYQRNAQRIEKKIRQIVPASIKKLLPFEHED